MCYSVQIGHGWWNCDFEKNAKINFFSSQKVFDNGLHSNFANPSSTSLFLRNATLKPTGSMAVLICRYPFLAGFPQEKAAYST